MELPGIGVWTSEMFLISCLKRMNIFSMTDAGLRRSSSLFYGINSDDTQNILKLSDKWTPYKSVASWCLWNALDNKLIKTNSC